MPLDGQISSSLVATLGDRLASQQVAVAPWRSAILPSGGATYRAAVSISRFDGIPGASVANWIMRPHAQAPRHVRGLIANTLMATPGRALAGVGLILAGLPFYAYWSRKI